MKPLHDLTSKCKEEARCVAEEPLLFEIACKTAALKGTLRCLELQCDTYRALANGVTKVSGNSDVSYQVLRYLSKPDSWDMSGSGQKLN